MSGPITVPMFPLNTVLFPGTVTPLLVFEDRYRALVRDLLAIEDTAERVLGVVAIREGYEVGEHGVQHAHRVGTLMQLTGAERRPDGRFDIEVTGRQRLCMERMDTGGEYFTASVELLDDGGPSDGGAPDARAWAQRALTEFERYRDELSRVHGSEVLAGRLPDDPTYLSYTLASTCLLTLPDRQQLLEADDAAQRLALLCGLLREERRSMRAVPSLPATEVARTRWSPN